MSDKLSYEEWKAQYTINVDELLNEDLMKWHEVDVELEIESALRQEYEFYLNGGFNK